jgi:transposase-like protein
MVREVGNLAKVARDLELTETSLRGWVKQAAIDEGKGPEGASTSGDMSPQLLKVVERARREPEGRFHCKRPEASPGPLWRA